MVIRSMLLACMFLVAGYTNGEAFDAKTLKANCSAEDKTIPAEWKSSCKDWNPHTFLGTTVLPDGRILTVALLNFTLEKCEAEKATFLESYPSGETSCVPIFEDQRMLEGED